MNISISPIPKLIGLCLLLTCGGIQLSAQLDSIHWVPPMHARYDWGPQYLYLSTPELDPFSVSIRDGAGTLLQTVSISNSQPFRYDLGSTLDTKTLVTEDQLQQPLQGKGLVIDGPKKFYAYYRAHSSNQNQAGDLTCKGRAALGKSFRVGHLLQSTSTSDRRCNFIGIIATEDSTLVTLSQFDPLTDFRINGADVQSTGPVNITLQSGESLVFSLYTGPNAGIQPPNGLMGALLESTKPVAVNIGSWLGSPVDDAQDMGIDQIAPLEKMGKEYILCKGNGSDLLERPMIVAHSNNTQIWLNGNANAVTTLQAGQTFIVTTASYSAAGNLYIRASEAVYVYQMVGGTALGDDAKRTEGLIFVPPISCAIPNSVDNIYQPNRIGDMLFDGGLMIVAMRDSMVTVRLNGTPVALGTPDAVPGNPDFVTYRKLNLFTQSSNLSTISVQAEGAVQVAMFGRNDPASFAAFYSGFSKDNKPEVKVSLVGDGVCPDTLYASGRFDGVQWVYEDSILQYGPDTFFVAYAPGQYKAVGYLGVCRRTDFAVDSVEAVFMSPDFPYTLEDPSCFGYPDGQITFGQPFGGIAPYQYSIDNGQHFSTSTDFAGVAAGNYKLVARDSTGCYNRPLSVSLAQPDSFYVDLGVLRANDPTLPNDEVVLEGVPNRPIVRTAWTPLDTSGCLACLQYTFYPMESTWASITVYDSAGCRAIDSLWVIVQPNVFVPNVIKFGSAQGENDHFTLFSREALPVHRLTIFDRWGEEMFEQKDFFTNATGEGWDGTFRGRRALPGVYVFTAEVEVVPGKVVTIKGDLLVL